MTGWTVPMNCAGRRVGIRPPTDGKRGGAVARPPYLMSVLRSRRLSPDRLRPRRTITATAEIRRMSAAGLAGRSQRDAEGPDCRPHRRDEALARRLHLLEPVRGRAQRLRQVFRCEVAALEGGAHSSVLNGL